MQTLKERGIQFAEVTLHVGLGTFRPVKEDDILDLSLIHIFGTVIYDEIDTGVSGLAAGRIGEKLKQTSKGRQVICITHTAQIAALADEHLLIQKKVHDNRTFTEIQSLDEEQRVRELARIISGDNLTELALANAREMLHLHQG